MTRGPAQLLLRLTLGGLVACGGSAPERSGSNGPPRPSTELTSTGGGSLPESGAPANAVATNEGSTAAAPGGELPPSPAPVASSSTLRAPESAAPVSGIAAPDNTGAPPPDTAGPPEKGSSGSGGPDSPSTCTLQGGADAMTPSIWVIGDSTASVYTSDLYPRMGWAQPLQDYFAMRCARIEDRAISGRSSKSFFDEGDWNPVRDALQPGDFVLIQFGHNDEKSDDPLRFTDPFTTFEQYLSTYIDDTLARGATPILITPINRNEWSGSILRDTHGDYPVAMRQLAGQRQLALVDATALTKTYFERLGPNQTTLLFMDLASGQFPNYPDGNSDDTHLQEAGARNVAQLLLSDFARQGLPIGHLVQSVPVAP